MHITSLVLAIAFALSSPMVIHAASSDCAPNDQAAGLCATNTGTSVEVGGALTDPGTGGGEGDTGPDGGSGADGDSGGGAPGDPDASCTSSLDCTGGYTVVMLPDVTAADLASFMPAPPHLTSEPDGVAVAGMPANLVASADSQLIPGTLFDYDVTVRFTPTGYRFDHGDGSATESDSGGRSWGSLGQAQLTPTPTSHVYAARGWYTVTTTVFYRAEVDFGTGAWRPVSGLVSATAPGQQIRVVASHTALVEHTCHETPHALGC